MAKQMTEITKRDLREMLENVDWWGRLEETEFLGRLYSIDELPSHDGRYKTAEQDIGQHRMNNADWPKDWIAGHERKTTSNDDAPKTTAWTSHIRVNSSSPIGFGRSHQLSRDEWRR